ncbi:hypothetical protein TNCV_4640081 [Trichonephila clavipes]|nr:hypothetical protein TNCV_4640081 [Trichonephila clavipes]
MLEITTKNHLKGLTAALHGIPYVLKISHGDYLIGSYLLSSLLDGIAYLIFLPQALSKLLDTAHVLPSLRRSMWYQNDKTPPHYGMHVH